MYFTTYLGSSTYQTYFLIAFHGCLCKLAKVFGTEAMKMKKGRKFVLISIAKTAPRKWSVKIRTRRTPSSYRLMWWNGEKLYLSICNPRLLKSPSSHEGLPAPVAFFRLQALNLGTHPQHPSSPSSRVQTPSQLHKILWYPQMHHVRSTCFFDNSQEPSMLCSCSTSAKEHGGSVRDDLK